MMPSNQDTSARLRYLNDQRVRRETNLVDPESVMRQMAEQIKEMMEYMPPPPSRNCSCHINPPCSDCVEHGHLREIMQSAETLIKPYILW